MDSLLVLNVIFIKIFQEMNTDSSVLIQMDSTYCKEHQQGTGARKTYGNQIIRISRGDKNTKIHLLDKA